MRRAGTSAFLSGLLLVVALLAVPALARVELHAGHYSGVTHQQNSVDITVSHTSAGLAVTHFHGSVSGTCPKGSFDGSVSSTHHWLIDSSGYAEISVRNGSASVKLSGREASGHVSYFKSGTGPRCSATTRYTAHLSN